LAKVVDSGYISSIGHNERYLHSNLIYYDYNNEKRTLYKFCKWIISSNIDMMHSNGEVQMLRSNKNPIVELYLIMIMIKR
jgi:hypothetical protein